MSYVPAIIVSKPLINRMFTGYEWFNDYHIKISINGNPDIVSTIAGEVEKAIKTTSQKPTERYGTYMTPIKTEPGSLEELKEYKIRFIVISEDLLYLETILDRLESFAKDHKIEFIK